LNDFRVELSVRDFWVVVVIVETYNMTAINITASGGSGVNITGDVSDGSGAFSLPTGESILDHYFRQPGKSVIIARASDNLNNSFIASHAVQVGDFSLNCSLLKTACQGVLFRFVIVTAISIKTSSFSLVYLGRVKVIYF